MKKTLLLCGMLIALGATAASAAPGVNLAWDNCIGSGVSNHIKTFACTSNSGNQTLYASAYAPPGIELFTGFSVEAYFGFGGPQPPWWQLRNQGSQTGQCRNGALTVNFDFTSNSGCADAFAGGGTGGIATYQNAPSGDVSRARLLLAVALPAGNEVPLTPDVEYYAAKMTLNNSKSTGLNSCAGCQQPACINLTSVKFVQPAGAPGGDVDVTTPAISNTAAWQAGGDANCTGLPTPAVRTTWGSVKSLYR
jgi:hypothetical protein